ncbi:MAG: fructose-bisphosphatase class III [Phycisphaerales bacterium]
MTATPPDVNALRALGALFPTVNAASAEIAGLRAMLGLPKGVVHVISDVHGEYAKLRHVINNASGALRPLVENLLGGKLKKDDQHQLLATIYYPRELMARLRAERPSPLADPSRRAEWVIRTLRLQFAIVRQLAAGYRRTHVGSLLPAEFKELFEELWEEAAGTALASRTDFVRTMLAGMAEHDRDLGAVRAASRLVRNLSQAEILVAGDLGDRGPRIDRVIDILMQQPRVSLLWGNHDTIWMGSCLGHDACIAAVLRFSSRYRRAAQLEEGYGIMTTPLEKLVRDVYKDDPAERFVPKGDGQRDPLTVARMQKALAIIEQKAIGRLINQHPEWNLQHRNLLHRIDHAAGTVEIDGNVHPLRDRLLPTVDPKNPYEYSKEERECMNRIRQSFTSSARLWEQMKFVCSKGGMWTLRDDALIFHACVPVDEKGVPLELEVEGRRQSGRALCDALGAIVRRAFRKGAEGLDGDADWLWYMWAGDRSPLFGKDKMTTFEGYFVEDEKAKKEHKNPYFELIHDADFTRRIGKLFGAGDDVLIVNGHVPVKVEKGEKPVKKGGNAVTIDGAFSEAYGDRGYSLILAPDRIALAEHHKFESVQRVVETGADIVPSISTIRQYPRPRTVADTEEGREIRQRIADLERLIKAYENGDLVEG